MIITIIMATIKWQEDILTHNLWKNHEICSNQEAGREEGHKIKLEQIMDRAVWNDGISFFFFLLLLVHAQSATKLFWFSVPWNSCHDYGHHSFHSDNTILHIVSMARPDSFNEWMNGIVELIVDARCIDYAIWLGQRICLPTIPLPNHHSWLVQIYQLTAHMNQYRIFHTERKGLDCVIISNIHWLFQWKHFFFRVNFQKSFVKVLHLLFALFAQGETVREIGKFEFETREFQSTKTLETFCSEWWWKRKSLIISIKTCSGMMTKMMSRVVWNILCNRVHIRGSDEMERMHHFACSTSCPPPLTTNIETTTIVCMHWIRA